MHTPDALWWFIWGYSVAATLTAGGLAYKLMQGAELMAEPPAARDFLDLAELAHSSLETKPPRDARGRFVARS